MPKPARPTRRASGAAVLAHAADRRRCAAVRRAVAARLARIDVGVVRPIVHRRRRRDDPRRVECLEPIEHEIGHLGIDAELDVRHDRRSTTASCTRRARRTARCSWSSAALQSWLPTLLGAAQHGLVATSPVPTALVAGGHRRADPGRAGALVEPGQAPDQRRPPRRAARRPAPFEWPPVPRRRRRRTERVAGVRRRARHGRRTVTGRMDRTARNGDRRDRRPGRPQWSAQHRPRRRRPRRSRVATVVLVADRESVARPIQTVQGIRVVS